MGNIRYQPTAHRITSAVNCRPLKPSPRSICPAAPYPTGGHIPGIPPPAKFATEPFFDLGEAQYNAQILQRPSPPGGALIKLKHFQRYETLPTWFEAIIQSWDPAIVDTETAA